MVWCKSLTFLLSLQCFSCGFSSVRQLTCQDVCTEWSICGVLEPVREVTQYLLNELPHSDKKQTPKQKNVTSVLTTGMEPIAHRVLVTPRETNSLTLSPLEGTTCRGKGLSNGLRPQVQALLTVLWGRDFILVYCIVLNNCNKLNNPDEHLTLQPSYFTVTECPLFSHFSNNALMGLTWTVPLGNA